MNIVRYIFLIFATSNLLLSAFAEQKLSKQQILTIAMSKAYQLGYTLEDFSPLYDEDNKKWDKYISETGRLSKKYSLLIQRDYQSVYFSPKQNKPGPDFWILIDRLSGKVITIIARE